MPLESSSDPAATSAQSDWRSIRARAVLAPAGSHLLKVFKKFRLPLDGEPFDSAYQYVETHY
jgi:hypothetical protein